MSDDSKSSSGKSSPAKSSIFRQESLERLSSPEQLDQLMQVVSAKSWIPLATIGGFILLMLLWSIFGRIPITATGEGVLVYPNRTSKTLIGLSFFARGEGDRIKPGMPIIIVPNTAGAERVGGLVGRVKEVSNPVAMTLNEALQTTATEGGSSQSERIEVIAELEPDSKSPTGYKWSSMGGSAVQLPPGTPTTSRIILEERAPIAFVFPFLEDAP